MTLKLRKMFELLSRNVVLKRRLPKSFGRIPFFVSPDASLRFWRFNLAEIDPMLLEVVDAYIKPGDIVWDIGANVGLFTFASAVKIQPTGKIISIEADPWLVCLLNRSCRIRKNKKKNIDILPIAVSGKTGILKFDIAQRGRAASHLSHIMGTSQSGGNREEIMVPSFTLDRLLVDCPQPDFLKIDVEGAELDVIKAAKKILEITRPKILCEISSSNRSALTELFKINNYSLFDAENKVDTGGYKPIDSAVWNTLALPD